MGRWRIILNVKLTSQGIRDYGTTTPNVDVNEHLRRDRTNITKNKIILLWNSFYGTRHFGAGAFRREAFKINKCKVNTCSLETDRGLLEKAAAVVFHIRGKMTPFPRHANLRQLFVYFLREPPPLTFENSPRYRKHFNITMTYRSDSDIPVPISRYVKQTNGTGTKHALKYPLSSKSGQVAWLVSHCNTSSQREIYVASLSEYISVDIYGNCGSYECARNTSCVEHLERNYKFYLSFENSYCKDYVTEKYYRTLNYEMIPIVYGGANYSKLGPPDSFINILDYRSPKHLASYLDFLSENEAAYLTYFQSRPLWKSVDVLGKAFCDLCELAHNETFHRIYSDVHEWWTRDSCDEKIVERIIASTKV
ncbi:hypothetical protein LSH36_1048g00010 [Paralvinella palmiformis]|uniref:Fucosyltransferase n=1 Tax=Paralvinella palmiformis TaxID=53620 RepID=A0AAD9IVN8_9ANNE|nr:hypothetical protein LSH36_1048g00010 [Paralvinella palmiformis]